MEVFFIVHKQQLMHFGIILGLSKMMSYIYNYIYNMSQIPIGWLKKEASSMGKKPAPGPSTILWQEQKKVAKVGRSVEHGL